MSYVLHFLCSFTKLYKTSFFYFHLKEICNINLLLCYEKIALNREVISHIIRAQGNVSMLHSLYWGVSCLVLSVIKDFMQHKRDMLTSKG